MYTMRTVMQIVPHILNTDHVHLIAPDNFRNVVDVEQRATRIIEATSARAVF